VIVDVRDISRYCRTSADGDVLHIVVGAVDQSRSSALQVAADPETGAADRYHAAQGEEHRQTAQYGQHRPGAVGEAVQFPGVLDRSKGHSTADEDGQRQQHHDAGDEGETGENEEAGEVTQPPQPKVADLQAVVAPVQRRHAHVAHRVRQTDGHVLQLPHEQRVIRLNDVQQEEVGERRRRRVVVVEAGRQRRLAGRVRRRRRSRLSNCPPPSPPPLPVGTSFRRRSSASCRAVETRPLVNATSLLRNSFHSEVFSLETTGTGPVVRVAFVRAVPASLRRRVQLYASSESANVRHVFGLKILSPRLHRTSVTTAVRGWADVARWCPIEAARAGS